MEHALRHLANRTAELKTHPLYVRMTDSRPADARRSYDNFVPILGFILTFPYYNTRYLRYRADKTASDALPALRHAIDEHAREDATHARLFLRDLRALGLDAVWGLDRPSTWLWCLWVSPRFDAVFDAQSRRLRALLRPTDSWPAFRFLHVEQLESDGHLLFSASTAQAARIREHCGVEPVYFGSHHLARESGHADAAPIDGIELDGAESAHAAGLVDALHDVSVRINDEMESFSRDCATLGSCGELLHREQARSLARVSALVSAHDRGGLPDPGWSVRPRPSSRHPALVARWQAHHATFINHPFQRAMHEHALRGGAAFALRCALLLFANRICSLHLFYRFDCGGQADPDDAVARSAHAIRTAFATEAELFFHDWDVLEMDRLIPWRVDELLAWWFLDAEYGRPEMEALHEFRRQALSHHDDPAVALWAIASVHFMSSAFFAATRPLAQEFARTRPDAPRLVYLEGIHHLLRDTTSPAPDVVVADVALTRAQELAVERVMDEFAACGVRQFDRLARALTADRRRFDFLDD